MEPTRFGERAPVRIVVCGPAGAGKTCFVTAAAMETFPERVPPHVPPTLLPIDALPDRVPALLVDTSSRAEDRAALGAALATAHAVVLCYALDAPRGAVLAALRDEWLPELRRAGGAAPVILLGCKLDTRASGSPAPPPLAPELLAELPCLEASLECSSKTLVAVHEAVYAAHRAVLYPTPPLFDAGTQALAPDAVAALRRIFLVCDTDGDGALSNSELNAFQEACFGATLSAVELEDVRRVVSERLPSGSGVTPNGDGLTLTGFLFLHAMFIEHGRADTVWAVLRHFGYDSTLRLSSAALSGSASRDGPLANRRPDASVELSDRAAAFLDEVFAHATLATSGALHGRQLEELFATAPGGAAASTAELGWTKTLNWDAAFGVEGRGLGRRAFAALWAMSALLTPRAVVEQLMYLGFPGGPDSALWLGKCRAVERAKRRAGARGRSTLQAYVCGPSHAGRSALLNAAVASNAPRLPPATHALRSAGPLSSGISRASLHAVAAIGTMHDTTPHADARTAAATFDVTADMYSVASGAHAVATFGAVGTLSRVTLVLREFDDDGGTAIRASPETLAAADIVVFVFDADSRASFEDAADKLTTLASRGTLHVPALLAAAHADVAYLPGQHHDSSHDPTWDTDKTVNMFCAAMGLAAPVHVCVASANDASVAPLLTRLVAEALAAVPAVPETFAAKQTRLRRAFLRRSIAYGASAAVLVGAGAVVYRFLRRAQRTE